MKSGFVVLSYNSSVSKKRSRVELVLKWRYLCCKLHSRSTNFKLIVLVSTSLYVHVRDES